MTTTHILVRSVEHSLNPEVMYFTGVPEVKNYIEKCPEVLLEEGAKFYKVDEIKPTRKVTIDVSL